MSVALELATLVFLAILTTKLIGVAVAEGVDRVAFFFSWILWVVNGSLSAYFPIGCLSAFTS